MNKTFRHWRERVKHWPHPWRMLIGLLLIVFGLVGFLPVVGFWMVPLGLLVLSIDFPIARRAYVNLALWWRRVRRNWFPRRTNSVNLKANDIKAPDHAPDSPNRSSHPPSPETRD